MDKEIVNKVVGSGLTEIDLAEFFPKGERVELDMKDFLFQGIVLKEKDFREAVKNLDGEKFRDKYVAIHCSADAIVPTWAYMLLAIALQPFAKSFVFGNLQTLETTIFQNELRSIDPEKYRNAKVVIKGCGDLPIPESAYVEITRILSPVAASIMYGEPCSTVPLFKRK